MAGGGFFTRHDARRKKRKSVLTDRTMTALGPGAIEASNKSARSPGMEPDRPDGDVFLYVLGGQPSEKSDENGIPFSCAAGRRLRNQLGKWTCEEAQFDYCVRTRLDSGEPPNPAELGCYRAVVTAEIEKTKPALVLLVGPVASLWGIGYRQVKSFHGELIPSTFGSHTCYAMALYSQEFLASIRDRREDKVAGEEWESAHGRDIEKVLDFIESPLEPPVEVTDSELRSDVVICRKSSIALEALRRLLESKIVSFDVETTGLSPHSKKAELLSIALSDEHKTYAIPLDHPDNTWSTEQKQAVVKALLDLFTSDVRLIAHNIPFDLEWMAWYLGEDILLSNYGCSMQAAYALDPGPLSHDGHLSLDLQCRKRFGISLKDASTASGDVKKLRTVGLDKVLSYNALDAKWTRALWVELVKDIKRLGLEESYGRQIERVPAIVLAQMNGVPIDVSVTAALEDQINKDRESVLSRIEEIPEIVKYKQMKGRFNPDSPAAVGEVLYQLFGVKSVRSGKSFATPADALEPLREDIELADLVLKLRSLTKLKGTYVDNMGPEEDGGYLFPDKKLHASYNIAKTRTTRLSSSKPNNQNWPKRKGKFVRAQMAAPNGYEFLSFDYGQLEARIMACTSRDPSWTEMVWQDHDVHMDWALKAAEIYPKALEHWTGAPSWEDADEKQRAAYRGLIKNQMVFPSFFGASSRSVASYLKMPEEHAEVLFQEFWEEFSGVKVWQKKLWAEYKRTGAVRSLTGRVRWGPLSFNMVCNTPVQGTASDVVVDGMSRLAYKSLEDRVPDLAAIINIHDDLTFLTPISERDWFVRTIKDTMLDFDDPWINVPLVVEGEVGPDMFHMDSIGTFKKEPACH